MSAVDAAGDVPVDLTDLDIRERAIEAAESVRQARRDLEYKTAGEGRIRDPERFELRQKAAHQVGYLASRELELLEFLAEHQLEERLTRLESELGVAED